MPSHPVLCGSIASHPSTIGQAIHNAAYQHLDLPFVYVAFGISDSGTAATA
jgi:shikimate 5-dehydrogenase